MIKQSVPAVFDPRKAPTGADAFLHCYYYLLNKSSDRNRIKLDTGSHGRGDRK